MISNNTDLTSGSLDLFLALARDADNWSGHPLFGGNVGHGKANKGHLTDLKKRGLVTTQDDERGDSFVTFTEAGEALAERHGIEID